VRKSRYSDDQIEAAVRQAESGASITEIIRKLGVSEATFTVWKKRFQQAVSEDNELTRLRYENAELKRLVFDLILDRQLCKANHAASDAASAAAAAVTPSETAQVMARN
jgi:putative transposase